MLLKLVTLLSFLLVINTTSARAELPHTFQAGQTAKASDVNENFKYLQKTKYVLKSKGRVIGDVVSFDKNTATIINEKGFLITVDVRGGVGGRYDGWFYYTGDNCTGQAYVDATLMDSIVWGMFKSYMMIETYYTRKSSSATVSIRSYLSNQVCKAYVTDTGGLSPAYENDFNITGVHNIAPVYYQFETPITLEER